MPRPAAPASAFDRIALSLSGGGLRAAAYALGTLKALDSLGLLDSVHMLSTASGGTITGAYYAMRRKLGDDFASIYRDLYRLLEQDALLPRALARWEQALAAASPRDKLIQAFADTYSQDVYGEARLGLFWEPDASAEAPFHLQSVIFGATELYSGLMFRFQHGAFLPAAPRKGAPEDGYVIGNGNVRLPSQQARQLRLGDVVAASTCFPAGFEAMVMPDDFLPEPHDHLLRGEGVATPSRVALLDGGISDNQGIESLLLANERNARHAEAAQRTHTPPQAALLQPTTLFLVADVSGADKGLYEAPRFPARAAYSPTLGQAFGGLVGALGLLAGAAGLLAPNPATRFWGGLLAGIGLLGAGLVFALAWGWRQLGNRLRRVGPDIPGWLLPRIKLVPINTLLKLLALRAGSTAALLTSVFTRRVRSLNYEQLYRRPAQSPTQPGYEVLTSIIGRIVTDYERQLARPRKKGPPKKPSVRQQLAAVYPTVWLAQQMPTTLWWQDHRHCLPALVASAEITLCYQLLRRFEKTPPVPGTREAEVQRRAQALWDAQQRPQAGPLQ